MSPQQIAVLVVAATLGALLLLLLVYGRPRRAKQEPLPANFSAGDPDSVLETSRLAKIQTWGLACAVACAGFIAIYLVAEPFREARYEGQFLEASIERGEEIYVEGAACAACHGPDLGGGFASTNTEWPAPPLKNVTYRYTRNEIVSIVERGRPGTPMPAWSVQFGGPLNPQKVEDVVNYVSSLQVEKDDRWELDEDVADGRVIFEQKCASCHGLNAAGKPLGKPLPTFYAPDLTDEFYRLGLGVLRTTLGREIFIANDGVDPTAEELDAAIAATPRAKVIEAGREAVQKTIEEGRTNTPMPAWSNRIRPEQIEAVINYLRSIQS